MCNTSEVFPAEPQVAGHGFHFGFGSDNTVSTLCLTQAVKLHNDNAHCLECWGSAQTIVCYKLQRSHCPHRAHLLH